MKKALLIAVSASLFYTASLFAQTGSGWMDPLLPPIVDGIVDGLEDDEYVVREDSEDLLSFMVWLFPDVIPYVDDSGANSTSPEVKMRINRVLNDAYSGWGNNPPMGPPAPPTPPPAPPSFPPVRSLEDLQNLRDFFDDF